jgi:hypothetical protein
MLLKCARNDGYVIDRDGRPPRDGFGLVQFRARVLVVQSPVHGEGSRSGSTGGPGAPLIDAADTLPRLQLLRAALYGGSSGGDHGVARYFGTGLRRSALDLSISTATSN